MGCNLLWKSYARIYRNLEFGDTIGEGLSYMEENLDEEVKSMSADFVDDINRVK